VFELEGYDILLAAMGCCVILALWLPRFVSGREPAAAALLIVLSAAAFYFVPGMPAPLDPTTSPRIWETATELTVIVALFGAGLRIDNLAGTNWRATARLLVCALPLTIVGVALLGATIGGLTVAGAYLLAAVLSPTDPVLAGDLQVGPPLEGGEQPVRLVLTTEAGLNDGLAFPFVLLGLVIATDGYAPGGWMLEWLARDVIYRIAVGAASGAAIGWLLGKIIFAVPSNNALARTESGVVALAGVLLCYGATELVEGYGFVAAFTAGLALRRSEQHSEFHRRLHAFSESIEHALTAAVLFLLGAVLPSLWPALEWRHAAVGLLLLLVVRPAVGWLSLARTTLHGRERALVAFYGIRGIGSIYYLSYATAHVELEEAPQLWAIVAYTILASTVLHGFTSGRLMDRFAGRAARANRRRDADREPPAR
jgi:NhaP-type Na+/H+ or K+/H+ antiporter